MTKRILFIVTVLTLAVMVATWRWALPNRGPLHKGKAVSYWVNLACENGSDYQDDIRAIGAPAVPYLIEKLTMKDDFLRDTVSSVYEKLPPTVQPHVPAVARSDMVRLHAAWALSWLGPKAKPAVAVLAKQVSDPSRADMFMAFALKAIGPEAIDAIPALHSALALTNNQTPHFQVHVASAIWSISRDTNLVVKVCTNAIMTSQADISAIWTISELGPAAVETLPLILRVVQDSKRSARARATAAWALACLNVPTPQVIETLKAGIEDSEPLVQAYAGIALWKMDTQYMPIAVPKILEGILALRKGQYYGESQEDFFQFVEDLGLDARSCVTPLTELRKSESSEVRQAAADALRRIESKSSTGPHSK